MSGSRLLPLEFGLASHLQFVVCQVLPYVPDHPLQGPEGDPAGVFEVEAFEDLNQVLIGWIPAPRSTVDAWVLCRRRGAAAQPDKLVQGHQLAPEVLQGFRVGFQAEAPYGRLGVLQANSSGPQVYQLAVRTPEEVDLAVGWDTRRRSGSLSILLGHHRHLFRVVAVLLRVAPDGHVGVGWSRTLVHGLAAVGH